MHSRSPIDLILYEASRKPEIARIIEELPLMNEDDINRLSLPLPWYRDALKQLKRKTARANVGETNLDHLGGEIILGEIADPEGEIHTYDGQTAFLPFGHRGGLVEVQTGKILFFPQSGGVWFETLYMASPLTLSTSFVCRACRSAYTRQYMDRLAQRMGVERGDTIESVVAWQRASAQMHIPGVVFHRI